MRSNPGDERGGVGSRGRWLVTAGLGLVVLWGGSVWSRLPEAQPWAGTRGLDDAHGARRARPDAQVRPGRVRSADEREEQQRALRMLGYTTEGATGDQGPSAARGSMAARPAERLAAVPHVPSGFQLALNQPYSTFAVDVDDASWVRTRKRLEGGGRPDPAEVRLEEFVNAMPYRYADPVDGDFAVATELVDHPRHRGWQLVRVGVQGRRLAASERPPLNLTFLVDTSGSMRGNDQLPMMQDALDPLVAKLGPADTLALVSFDGVARVDLRAVPADGAGRRAFDRALDGLVATGGTGMSMGLDLAYEQASRHHRPGAVSRVVLISDGDANIGRLSGAELARSIEDHARAGVLLTVLGVGTGDAGDRTLETLSNRGEGQYFALGDREDAKRVLVDDFVQTFVPLARDVKLQVEWDPNVVRAHRMLGYDNRQLHATAFRQDAVDGGEVGMGHQVTALFVVQRVPWTEEQALGVLRLRAEPPGPDTEATETAFVLHGPSAPSPADASADTLVAMAAASLAGELRGRPLLPLDDLVGPLERAVDRSERAHVDLLGAVRGNGPTPRPGVQGRSGVVSLRTDPGAFEEVAVRCDGAIVGRGGFQGGRAVVSGLPDGSCVADLRGGRPTVSLAVVEGASYRCDGRPLRCRAEE